MSTEINLMHEKFPFLSVFKYANEEYIGIIQNYGKNVVSAYVFNNIKDQELKKKFLELGQIWWWESNRKVPINLFFKSDFDIFNQYAINFITKEFTVVNGHIVSLNNLNQRRVKRRRIELVVKPKK